MSVPYVIQGPDGKPVFTGKEDPHNPPVSPTVGEGSKIECPICHGQFDYLVGDDTPDGGKRGCETCWKAPPPRNKPVATVPELSVPDVFDSEKI